MKNENASAPTAPESAPPAPAEAPWPPPRPKSMKVLGVLAIILGALMTLINTLAPVFAMAKVWGVRGAGPVLAGIPVIGGLWLIMSFLLLVGGIGMVLGRMWGRRLCLVYAVPALPLMALSALALIILSAVVQAKGGPSESFNVLVASVLFPIFSVLLMSLLMTGENRKWADRMLAGPDAAPSEAPGLSVLALLSLVFSLVLFPPVFFQIPGIILGFMALKEISRSGGRLRGRGMARLGIVFGFLVPLLAVIGVVVLIVAIVRAERGGRTRREPAPAEPREKTYEGDARPPRYYLPDLRPHRRARTPGKRGISPDISPSAG